MDSTQRTRLRESVAEEVRVAMVRRRVNGAALADAIGRSQAYISRRLSGETSFDLDDLEKIAAVLSVRIVDLFPLDDGEENLRKRRSQVTIPAPRPAIISSRPGVGRPANRHDHPGPGLRQTAPTGR